MTTPIPTLPPAPSRTDPATFSDKSDALLTALAPWAVAVQAVGDEAEAAATSAAAQAAAAAVSATAAAASALTAGAIAWVSGTTYDIGNVRYSPANFQTYRRKTAGAGTIDPSLDTTNWTLAIVVPVPVGNLLFLNSLGGF